jgi:predicted ATPase/DNA-binding CsgD family transcriptional regulator
MKSFESQLALDPLTDRELDVLRLMADGRTTRQIADGLFVTVETVRWYAKQIYSKLGVHSRSQAALRARDLGLFQAQGPINDRPRSPRFQHNLPLYPTAFVGREEEFYELATLLSDSKARLITIAGPAGIGKTRLGVEAACAQIDRFADGVYFVPLAPLTAADQIVPAIAREIHLPLTTETKPEAQLLRYLQSKQMLLLLDNFEHLLEGVPLVGRLLQATRAVKILATSMTALNLRHEWVRPLDGMRLPSADAGAELQAYSAVQLFLDCVQRVRRDFSLAENRDCVVEICRQLDGMPLAIELAATWLKSLSCMEVAREIRRDIDFLMTKHQDVDERHRSLRAVFDYSWRLLTEQEREVLQRLSVFHGGFGRGAAEQVAVASVHVLSNLVDKSFLIQSADGSYQIHELLRQYAASLLEQRATGTLTTRSRMLLTWSTLVKGDFEKAKELAEGILASISAELTPIEEAFGLSLLGVLAGMEEDYERCLQMCGASLALSTSLPDLDDPITFLFSQLGMAVAHIGLDDYYSAGQHIRSALRQANTLRSPAFVTLCLPVMAVVLAHAVEMEGAIELVALAFSHRVPAPTWMQDWPPVACLQEDWELELGSEAYAAEWNRGQGLELQTVVARLLEHSHDSV